MLAVIIQCEVLYFHSQKKDISPLKYLQELFSELLRVNGAQPHHIFSTVEAKPDIGNIDIGNIDVLQNGKYRTPLCIFSSEQMHSYFVCC